MVNSTKMRPSLKLKFFLLFALAIVASLVTIVGLSPAQPPVTADIDLQEALSDQRGDFKVVTPGRKFAFPIDHGEHPGFKTEWWYFTGNVLSDDGLEFGYQVTLFRVGLANSEGSTNPSRWATDSLLMGHLAVSDISEQKFFSFERFSRRAMGLAGVEENGSRIWLESWIVNRLEKGWSLRAKATEGSETEVALELSLLDVKPLVLQGEEGYSRKGPADKYASYYVSQTRLDTKGNITINGSKHNVTGSSWFDHEWSSEAMAEGLVGWDWFSLQLEDNTEVMVYLLRYQDGRIEEASSGAYVDAQGQKTNLKLADLHVTQLDSYRSSKGIEYPSKWRLEIPGQALRLDVVPKMAEQEMTSGVPYWEGAVRVSGTKGGNPIKGHGFVELTGYK